MNILIINVSLRPESPVKFFPVGLGYIVTSIKNAGFDFDLLDIDAHRYSDSEVEKLITRKKYDVVCMGCIVTGYKIIKKLASVIKEKHPFAKVIVGNSVATSIVNTLLSCTDVDIAVMGEGDDTIVDLLNAINKSDSIELVPGICFKKGNRIIKSPARSLIKDISSLPFIDYSLFDVEIYIESSKEGVNDPLPLARDKLRALPVNTARGCIGNCTFCYHNFKGMPYRYRTPDSIVEEIKLLLRKYSLNYINFWDELTFFSKKHTLELVQKIIDEKVFFYWRGNCRADLFNDEEDIYIINKMKEAGCIGMSYSLESADESILKQMNKHISSKQFSKQTKIFHKAGLPVWTSLVFGYPQETPESIKKTFHCCINNNIYPSSGFLLPQPGSKMYTYAKEHGYITDEEEYLIKMGDRQDLTINLTNIPDKELQKYIIAGLKKCNEKLEIGLEADKLIKTQYYRGPQKVIKTSKDL